MASPTNESHFNYSNKSSFTLIENYIYIYQLNKYVIIPVYPESITDSLGSTFSEENILSRTAPIQSYSNSGPRRVQFTLPLHRDMMNSFNWQNNSFIDEIGTELNEDYIDTLIRYLQAMALPSFKAVEAASSKYNRMVNPPVISCRFGNTIFIKGIVSGDVGVTYEGPIDANGKYVQVNIIFNVVELEPQDAESIAKNGSFRSGEVALTAGLHKSMER